MCACGGKQENPEARELLDNANAAFEQQDYALATTLLDSLQKTFPSELGIQRESMALRPKVIEQTTVLQLQQLDSLDAADTSTLTALKPALKWVKTPGMIEGYWIDAKAYNPNFMNTTGIEARVNEIGQFYIVSSVNPAGNLKHTSVTLKTGSESVTTQTVPYDGESNYRLGGGEVITFSPEQSDTIGFTAMQAVNANPSATGTLIFNGAKNTKSIRLNAAQTAAIANAYRYSSAVIRARDNQVQRQKLNRTIEIARQQAAKTSASATE
jgi:hypothetical protein